MSKSRMCVVCGREVKFSVDSGGRLWRATPKGLTHRDCYEEKGPDYFFG